MNIKINFKNRVSDKSTGNLILFVDEKLNVTGLKKVLSNNEYSYISDFSSIGEGTCIGHHVAVNAGVDVGKYCILNTKCLIEHDSTIGEFCHISTGAIINGHVNIGSESFVGSGTIIREGVKIPPRTIIGAGKCIMAWPMEKEQSK